MPSCNDILVMKINFPLQWLVCLNVQTHSMHLYFLCYYGSSYDMPSEPKVIFFVWYLNLWLSNDDDYLFKWRQTSCICIFNSNWFLPASLLNYIFAWRSILWFYRESLRTNFCGFNIIIAQNQNVDRRKPFIIQTTLLFF